LVDFKKLTTAAAGSAPLSLSETFARLDREVSHVELRPSQIKILQLMDAKSLQRDVVVKLNTGGGKTTIGLIYLKQKLDLLKQPVVYLVPTVQLVDQVLKEGRRIGFPVHHWASGESYPPDEALVGRGAIVCTYEKFFNGKSTFARSDVRLVPAAVVLDDVHAGIESVRKCFTSDLPDGARVELMALLGSELQDTNPSQWVGVEGGDHRAVLEVPHWIFTKHVNGIRAILQKYAGSQEMMFSWPNLAQLLENCRLVLSGVSGQIAVDPPAVDRVQHYLEAKHRLFMSASIHDGAVLIRELDCDSLSAAEPVEIGGEAAVGERMVIVPSPIDPDFSDDEIRRIVFEVSVHANVVVLVSSRDEARPWADMGATVATNETIGLVIDQLKARPNGQVAVFVARYDGIDLPDNACRLLIIHGLPRGESLLDRADLEMAGGVIGVRGKVANRLEQGLGRAVRSASDYCAVLLSGRDVAGFVSRAVVLENFSSQTVKQIQIGRTVSEALKEAGDKVVGVVDTVMQCLRRDNEWKNYYLAQMAVEDTASIGSITDNATRNSQISQYERQALKAAISRDFASAAKLVQLSANLCGTDRMTRGVLKQAASKYQFHVDAVGAMELQVSAYSDNGRVSRPPTLLPVDIRRITSQAEAIAGWLSGFAEKNGALIELDELRSRLSFANPWQKVEDAVRRLGELLGAESTRPDDQFGRGPDNLWVFGGLAIAIEMKSEKSSSLSKDDAEQLQSSSLWVSDNVAKLEVVNPIIGSNADSADNLGDFAYGAKRFAEVDFSSMVERLRRLVSAVTAQGPLFASSPANVQRMLGPNELLPAQLLQLARAIKQKKFQ
jgi:hypothetical protein